MHKGALAQLAQGPPARRERVWLIGKWRRGERENYLRNLPPRTALRRLAALGLEQAQQPLKQELGLDFSQLAVRARHGGPLAAPRGGFPVEIGHRAR